jgi:hypothetical protein
MSSRETYETAQMLQSAARVVGTYPETKHPVWHDQLLKKRGHKTTITDVVIRWVMLAVFLWPALGA